MRRALLWDTALGFVGFFAFLALVQAVLNLFSPLPRHLAGAPRGRAVPGGVSAVAG